MLHSLLNIGGIMITIAQQVEAMLRSLQAHEELHKEAAYHALPEKVYHLEYTAHLLTLAGEIDELSERVSPYGDTTREDLWNIAGRLRRDAGDYLKEHLPKIGSYAIIPL